MEGSGHASQHVIEHNNLHLGASPSTTDPAVFPQPQSHAGDEADDDNDTTVRNAPESMESIGGDRHVVQEGGGDANPPANIFVNFLPTTYTDTQLVALFQPFGRIISARVMRHLTTRNSKGYGFVELASGADEAIRALDGYETPGGKRLAVRLATNPAPLLKCRVEDGEGGAAARDGGASTSAPPRRPRVMPPPASVARAHHHTGSSAVPPPPAPPSDMLYTNRNPVMMMTNHPTPASMSNAAAAAAATSSAAGGRGLPPPAPPVAFHHHHHHQQQQQHLPSHGPAPLATHVIGGGGVSWPPGSSVTMPTGGGPYLHTLAPPAGISAIDHAAAASGGLHMITYLGTGMPYAVPQQQTPGAWMTTTAGPSSGGYAPMGYAHHPLPGTTTTTVYHHAQPVHNHASTGAPAHVVTSPPGAVWLSAPPPPPLPTSPPMHPQGVPSTTAFVLPDGRIAFAAAPTTTTSAPPGQHAAWPPAGPGAAATLMQHHHHHTGGDPTRGNLPASGMHWLAPPPPTTATAGAPPQHLVASSHHHHHGGGVPTAPPAATPGKINYWNSALQPSLPN